MRFAHGAGNELGILRAKIKDQNLLRHGGPKVRKERIALSTKNAHIYNNIRV